MQFRQVLVVIGELVTVFVIFVQMPLADVTSML